MPGPERSVTVIIPSRGRRVRAESLQRAVASVRQQAGVHAIPLVVLNGAQQDADLADALRATGARVIVRERADLPSAHREGRAAVETPWFATLDDDDVLLPGALEARVRALEAHPGQDVVVTNGFVRRNGQDTLQIPVGVDVAAGPLRVLCERNWLLPGSWLARSERIGPTLYDGMPRYLECTFLALRFATEYAMLWLPTPTVVYHVGSPEAESQTREYLLGQMDAFRSLLTLSLPPWYQRHIRREISAAYHDAADHLRLAGPLADAWRMHLRSLASRGGALRYLPFTRHLVRESCRRAVPRATRATS